MWDDFLEYAVKQCGKRKFVSGSSTYITGKRILVEKTPDRKTAYRLFGLLRRKYLEETGNRFKRSIKKPDIVKFASEVLPDRIFIRWYRDDATAGMNTESFHIGHHNDELILAVKTVFRNEEDKKHSLEKILCEISRQPINDDEVYEYKCEFDKSIKKLH